jgi:putative redox protein
VQVRIKWVEGVSFVGESETGHAVVLDGAPENGGRNIGMRPMEMLLIGMGACTSFDVVLILKKARQPIVDCVAEITAERADEIPKVFTKIHVHFVITGDQLNATQVERAVKLSAEKYCSASIMLSKSVEITHDYEIISSTISSEIETVSNA